MELEINGKNALFKFGLAFLRELDKTYYSEQNGVRLGLGLDLCLTQLLGGYPEYLATVLFCANRHTPANKGAKLTQPEIDSYVEDTDDLEGLFDAVIDELKESNVTKSKVAAAEAALKQGQEQEQEPSQEED